MTYFCSNNYKFILKKFSAVLFDSPMVLLTYRLVCLNSTMVQLTPNVKWKVLSIPWQSSNHLNRKPSKCKPSDENKDSPTVSIRKDLLLLLSMTYWESVKVKCVQDKVLMDGEKELWDSGDWRDQIKESIYKFFF